MDRSKVEVTSAPRPEPDPEDELTAIVKVSRPDYVPEGCSVRARIDATLFTAAFRSSRLRSIEEDPAVVSVGLPTPLRSER